MDLLDQLEVYINAQRGVGLHAILFGSGLLIMATLFHLYGDSALSYGIKIGSLVLGILLFIMGFGLRTSQAKLGKEKKALFQQDKVEFKQSEFVRMQKVKNNFPYYQITMSAIVVLCLLVVLFVRSPFWQGVAFSVIVFMVGNMIIEAFSNYSVLSYYDVLKE